MRVQIRKALSVVITPKCNRKICSGWIQLCIRQEHSRLFRAILLSQAEGGPPIQEFQMQKRRWYLASLVVTLTVLTVPVLSAENQSSIQSPSELQAMPVLKNMSEYLAHAERFSVTIRDGCDVVQESEQKIEFGNLRIVTVSYPDRLRRPDRLRIEVERSDGQKDLVIFDGKDMTIYTANDNIYATTARQGTLDQEIKYALDDLKIRMPLSLMFLSTLPGELDKLGVSAEYVETTTITDVPCDHLAVRTAGGVDFQVWIAQGAEPLPRRIVITYEDEHGQPQFSADLSNWNLAPDVSDALFAFTPPNGAERIQFLAEVRSAAATATPTKGGKK